MTEYPADIMETMITYPNDIKELAKTVLVNLYPEVDDSGKPYLPYEDSFGVIAKAIMAERERCAAIADRRAAVLGKIKGYHSEVVEISTLAVAIRAPNDDRARIWDDERKVYVHNPALSLSPLQEEAE